VQPARKKKVELRKQLVVVKRGYIDKKYLKRKDKPPPPPPPPKRGSALCKKRVDLWALPCFLLPSTWVNTLLHRHFKTWTGL